MVNDDSYLNLGVQRLKEQLENANKREAILREALQKIMEHATYESGIAELALANNDAGSDYVPRSELERLKNDFANLMETAQRANRQAAAMRKALEGVINRCVHPETAVRCVMVDLEPIRAALAVE